MMMEGNEVGGKVGGNRWLGVWESKREVIIVHDIGGK